MGFFRTLRFDVEEDAKPPSELLDVLNSYSCKYWFHYELGDLTQKPHYQGWIESDVKSEYKPLRACMKKLFGAHHYSYGEREIENYNSYVANNSSKVYDETRIYHNYPQEWDRLSLPVYIDKRKSGGKTNPLLTRLIEECKEADVVQNGKLDYDYLSEIIIQFLMTRRLLIGPTVTEKYFCSVAVHFELEFNLEKKVYKYLHKCNKKFYSIFNI